jgi:eukaryotic-like serine/threonine-protein kinase
MVPLDREEPEARRVERYTLHGELASGGMATVHLGRLIGSAGFSRIVAVKRLHQHLATEPDYVTMLIDEAKLASFIHHPNVVSSLDVISEGDELLLVMDYVEGETLSRLLGYSHKGEPLRSPPVSVVVRVLTDVLAGLHAAHTAKTHGGRELHVVHRDVSPQNIMVGVDGIARVLDFGIAKAAHRRHVTQPGRIKGKWAYMSPEQVRGNPVDARTDVFAAGVVLWECLTKRRLFASSDKEGMTRVLTAVVPPPSSHNPEVMEVLDRIVLRALNRDKEARFASAAEFADALSGAAELSTSVEVGRWVAAAAKRTLEQRRRLLENVEENTADDVIEAIEARAVEKTRVIAPALVAMSSSNTPKGSHPPALLSAFGLVTARTPAPAWPRIALLVAGVSLFCVVTSAMLSRPSSSAKPAPLPPSASAKVEVSPKRAANVTPIPIVVPTDLPGLPAPEPVETAPAPTSEAHASVRRAVSTTSPASASTPGPRARAAKRVPVKTAGKKPAPPQQRPEPKAPPALEPAPAPIAAPCDLPYRVDAAGIRRVKRECL